MAANIADAVRDTVTVRAHTRVACSNTAQHVPLSSPATRSSPHRAPPTPPQKPPNRRSHSQDHDRAKSKHKNKKGSQHADVIDRLDFTGVGPMFHHDGPFDACAPSRNRQRSNAPMFAWSPRQDDLAATDAPVHPSIDPPKKKVDAIAEAWGIHEPEPFEEFFAGGGRADNETPASSIYNGRDPKKRTPRPSTPADRQPKRALPPPQPIFAPESPPLSPGGNPQRKKSLMQRIRKMRDSPNVPVSTEYDQPPSPSNSSEPMIPRPTHRSQNSFLGRFAGSRAGQPGADKSEPFVYIEPSNKELPPPPPDAEVAGYFDSTNPGVARKPSLMKKVGRVVGRSR
ncbi:hypothetical protein C0992_006532 [Termitomyces sp. T32_za158]|nr:hypothetical protein C0992_006532 [Termitomyces sp. T32_za158]